MTTPASTGAVVLQRYELRGRAGGEVWRAHDLLLRRDVALRRLPTSTQADPDLARQHAHRQGRAAAGVHHTALAAIYDMAEVGGDVVLVTEFLHGAALDRVLTGVGRLTPEDVARVGRHLAGALAAAHRRGVVHGHVEPAAVLLGLTDSGAPDGGAALTGLGVPPAHGLTAPAFLAPELRRAPDPGHGAPATPAGDLWALGAVLHTALEGHPPAPGAATCRPGPLGALVAALLSPDAGARPEATRAHAALDALVEPEAEVDSEAEPDPVDESHTTPMARVREEPVYAPTRTWVAPAGSRATAPRSRRAAPRRRLAGAGLAGAGLLAAGAVGVVVTSLPGEPASTTTALAPPVPELLPTPAAPVVTPPITPPPDPGPAITAVPLDDDPVLAAASEEPREGSGEEFFDDLERERDRDSDRGRDDSDRDSDRGSDRDDRNSDDRDRDRDRDDSDDD